MHVLIPVTPDKEVLITKSSFNYYLIITVVPALFLFFLILALAGRLDVSGALICFLVFGGIVYAYFGRYLAKIKLYENKMELQYACVRDRLLTQPDEIVFSKEKYDWLGHGMYFWENNYARALQWAEDKKARGRIEKPSVIGAILFLDHCCDFLDSSYINLLKKYFDIMEAAYIAANKKTTRKYRFASRHV